MAIYLEAVQVDHSRPGKYRLGLDLSPCLVNNHSCFFGPWIGHQPRGPSHFLFMFLRGLVTFLEYCLFSCLECVLEAIASRTTLERNPMEKKNVINNRTLGRGDLADQLHQLTKICTTTTSTSQVSWQHPLLENPIRHCIISRTASALYLIIC